MTSITIAEREIVPKRRVKCFANMTCRIIMQAFVVTFLAEWSDRSQMATMILGAHEDAYGVIVGGIIGHLLCTGLALVGGRNLAQRMSIRGGK